MENRFERAKSAGIAVWFGLPIALVTYVVMALDEMPVVPTMRRSIVERRAKNSLEENLKTMKEKLEKP